MRIRNLFAAVTLAGAATLAQAVVVESSFSHSAGPSWIGQFIVWNDGTVPSVESFTIYFDYGKATNLLLVDSPSWWDTIVVQPDDALAAPGFLDALQTDPSAGLGVGDAQKGFSVEFDWSGVNAPGPFAFSVNDPVSFAALEAGRTVVVGGSAPPVPEPSTWFLMALGLISVAMKRVKMELLRR